MQNRRFDAAAALLVQNWCPPVLGDALPQDARPETLGEGYEIQDRALVLSGFRTGGWKLAVTDPTAQARYGITEPITGRLPADGIVPSPATVEVSSFPGGRSILEVEVGLRIGQAGSEIIGDHRAIPLEKLVATVFACAELPALRFRDMKSISAATFAADNAGSSRVIIGRELPGDKLDLLKGAQAHVSINDERLASGWVGDLETTLRWLVRHIHEDRKNRFREGDLVLTGALTGVHQIKSGDRVVAQIDKLGQIEIDFV